MVAPSSRRREIALLDEPLASLDTNLKSKIIPFFARIRDEFQVPMLYVTHDWNEVQSLCTEALIMERGKIVRRELIGSAGKQVS